MLVCAIAAKAPRIIDRAEATTMICCHWLVRWPNGSTSTRTNSAMAATFGATAKKAVTGVGAPS